MYTEIRLRFELANASLSCMKKYTEIYFGRLVQVFQNAMIAAHKIVVFFHL
jgi:hypothetical protein